MSTKSFQQGIGLTLSRGSLLFAFVVVINISALAARKERLIDSWKPLHYDISLSFNNSLSEIIKARTVITIQAVKNVSTIDLDFGELPVDAVNINGSAATFARVPGQLLVTLPQTLPVGGRVEIAVDYHGAPKDGLILSTDKAGKPSAVGDNWPDRVHHWIPCLDHPSAKATVSFNVTAPAADSVVANGKFLNVTTSENERTWSYTEGAPIPPYCMIVAVGEFARIEMDDAPVTPLAYYVPSPDKNNAVAGFSAANPSLKYFTETVAPYPYEKLALIVGATRFGGMENSSAIVFPNRLLESNSARPVSEVFKVREGLVDVVAHEIAHQWFGDSVTESTWSDLWLSEGFATYFAGLMIERYEGKERFRAYMQDAGDAYLNFEKTTRLPIHDTETTDLFKLLNANNYQKGAWVLHMLRAELGDDVFFRGIRSYYEAHKSGLASTDDLRQAFEAVSGRNLREFFQRWIYEAGHPHYQLSWSWNRKTKRTRLVLVQTQADAVFPNAVPIELISASKSQRLIIKPSARRTSMEVSTRTLPSSVMIDPDNVILDESQVVKKTTPN
ncbi:MAG TPA: M1 family metallopeptidase [Pyrinomonadaceae bacterium]|nr:M1 family metallopeptidase [Pyrinomonadaceae bacterium]